MNEYIYKYRSIDQYTIYISMYIDINLCLYLYLYLYQYIYMYTMGEPIVNSKSNHLGAQGTFYLRVNPSRICLLSLG